MNSSIGTMTVSKTYWRTHSRTFHVLTSILLLAACVGCTTQQIARQAIYMLEVQHAAKPAQDKRNIVLAVSVPQARPGFDTPQMAYVQQPYELNYFVTSRWTDTPARMLEPLLVQALEQTGGFRAVVQTPNTVSADFQLDTILIRLQQDFMTRPSRIRLTLRAQLIDVRSQRVLAVKLFDESENAESENAYGGVIAANRVAQRVLDQLAEFCVRESVIQK
jgi:cholesterol transport system auxiliary component